MKSEKAGEYAFLVCILIALIAGIATPWFASAWIALLLVILGIVVGFTTVTEKETTPFLVAAIALVVAGALGAFVIIDFVVAPLGTIIQSVVSNIATFVAIAAIIVAIKAVYALAAKK